MKKICALLICAATAFLVFGCASDSGKDQIESSESAIETSEEETSTTVAESVETEASTETTEESVTPLVIEADDGYYVDYPLDMGQQYIYVRCIPGFDFYPDEVDDNMNESWYERYINSDMTYFMLFSSPETADINGKNAGVSVTLNGQFDIDWIIENAETGWASDVTSFIEIGEPEICENGIKIYEVKTTILNDDVDFIQTDYFLEYEIDDANKITIDMNGFVPTTVISKNPGDTYFDENPPGPVGFEGYLEPILDFFRTTEDPFLIVDKDATVIWGS